MFLSKLFLPLKKEDPKDAELVSHKLMIKSGLIKQVSAGIYCLLPVGLKILRKIETKIRNEMNAAGFMEILLPTLQPSSIWEESGRYNTYGNEMLKIKDRHERELVYGPTAEEAVVFIAKNELKSYKDLPTTLYNIQWKFRDEIRPRHGVMRSREFLMLDSYSFHNSQSEAEECYKLHYDVFVNIFFELGIKVFPVSASSGEIGGSLTHEFHVLSNFGESEIYIDQKFIEFVESQFEAKTKQSQTKIIENQRTNTTHCGKDYTTMPDGFMDKFNDFFAKTDEKITPSDISSNPSLVKTKSIEVGHIFYFGDKYSKSMDLFVTDKDGKRFNPLMGSYGIGPARIMAAYIELSHDENGIIWNKHLSPFDICITSLIKNDNSLALQIYQGLSKDGFDVLFDDTSASAGEKFSRFDLLGIPVQVFVTQKLVEQNCVEIKIRKTGERSILKIEELTTFLNNTCR